MVILVFTHENAYILVVRKAVCDVWCLRCKLKIPTVVSSNEDKSKKELQLSYEEIPYKGCNSISVFYQT